MDSHLGAGGAGGVLGSLMGSGPEPWGLELPREAPSGAEIGVWWGRPLPLGAAEG